MLISNTVRRFRDRGYTVLDQVNPETIVAAPMDDLAVVLYGVCSKPRKRVFGEEDLESTVYAQAKMPGGGLAAAFFINESTQVLGVNAINQFLKYAESQGFSRVLLVFHKPIAPPTRKVVLGASTSKRQVELLHLHEMMYIPIDNEVVPIYRALSDEEAEAQLAERRLLTKNLMPIERNDPIAKYFGARPGQIFFIRERVGTSGFASILKRVQ